MDTSLHRSLSDHTAAALVLLAAAADISLRCGVLKRSALNMGAEKGHVDILTAMLEHGVDVYAVDTSQNTALHIAAAYNKVEAINVLVEAGASIEARACDGSAPLHCAAAHLSLDAVIALLKHGADVNPQSLNLRTPLHFAAFKGGGEGSAAVVDVLLRAGADEAIADNEGKTPSCAIGWWTARQHDRPTEDIELVRELLANAPADRAWRRQGYLVLCRAHPRRVQRGQESRAAAVVSGR